MTTQKLRIAILQVDPNLSPLKLKGWLNHEVQQISEQAKPYERLVIRLYLSERVRYGFTVKKLDALMKTIAERYHNVFGMEYTSTPEQLDMATLLQEEQEQGSDGFYANEEEGLEQFFGYLTEASQAEHPFDLPEEGLVCMVSNVTQHNRDEIQTLSGKAFSVGQWFLSEGGHHDQKLVIHGPFDGADQAMKFGYENCKAVRFKGAPIFSS